MTADPDRRRPDDRRADAPPLVEAPLVDPPSPVRAVIFVLFVGACVGVVALTPLKAYAGPEAVGLWRARLDALGAWAPAAFFVVNALAVAVGVPRLLFAALAGALFGWIAGAGLSHYAGLTGSWLTFAVGRSLGRDVVSGVVERRMPRARRFLGFVGRNGLLSNVFIRLAPVGHAFTSSLLMSVSPVSTSDFLLGTFLGSLPHTLVFALFGSAAKGSDWEARIVGGAGAFLALAVFVGWWVRRIGTGGRDAPDARPGDP